eukprot:IDg20539t1
MLEVANAVAGERATLSRRAKMGQQEHQSAKVVSETFYSNPIFLPRTDCLYHNKRTMRLNTRRLLTRMYENLPI